jgi:DNA invertase Pin-like site-specific DNA recombinase
MSQQLVNQYLSEIDRLRKISGLSNEQIIRPAFRRLLAEPKKKVIDLIARVTRVSVETMEIVEAMKSEKRA